MSRPCPEDDAPALDAAARQLENGHRDAAAEFLVPVLERREDPACRLAAMLLRQGGDPAASVPPGALAAALDRMVTLVDQQEAQIRTLRALIEESL